MQINQYISNSTYQCNLPSRKSQNFTSRKAVVRELGDIVRLTRREFPMASNTHMEHFLNIMNPVVWPMYRYADALVGEIRGFAITSKEGNIRLIKTFDSMKNLKVGNCCEYAQATYLACKLNGYKDVKYLALYAYNPKTKLIRDLDHAVVGVNFKDPTRVKVGDATIPIYTRNKEGVILDSWTGYTDFERNATSNYKQDKIFGKLDPDEYLCYRESAKMDALNRDDYLYLKHKYPKLSKKQKFSLKDKLRWWVIDKKQYDFDPLGTNIKQVYKHNYNFKGALTSDELTALLTNEAHKSQMEHLIKHRLDVAQKHKLSTKVKNKIKEYGRKIFK